MILWYPVIHKCVVVALNILNSQHYHLKKYCSFMHIPLHDVYVVCRKYYDILFHHSSINYHKAHTITSSVIRKAWILNGRAIYNNVRFCRMLLICEFTCILNLNSNSGTFIICCRHIERNTINQNDPTHQWGPGQTGARINEVLE